MSVTLCPRVKSPFFSVTWDARFYPLTECVPWPSCAATRCSSCADPRPPGDISQDMVQDSGKVAGPCFASPVPLRDGSEDEDEGESEGGGEGQS